MEQALDNAQGRRTDPRAVIVPLAFWTFAMLSVGLFAAVLLLPRLEQLGRLESRAETLSAELDRMREKNHALARRIEALDHDPFYVGQVARRDLGFGSPGEGRIPLGRLDPPRPPLAELEPERVPWLEAVRTMLTHDPNVRRAAVVTAGVLLLCAFVFFNRVPEPRREPAGLAPTDLEGLTIVDGIPMDRDDLPVIDAPSRRAG